MEARSFSQEKSQQLMRKVKEYKADLKKITDDSRQAQAAGGGISRMLQTMTMSHCTIRFIAAVSLFQTFRPGCMLCQQAVQQQGLS